jgi:hypothetical protein
MAQDLGQLTDMWMVNPTMFDPTQASNQFSQYNNQRFPFPPTYNTGAGGPVNAATGQPIQSFQQWQAANPGGVSINSTPATPAAPPTDMMAMRNAALTGQPGAALAYGANFAPAGSPPGIQQLYGQNFAAFTPKQNWQPQGAVAAAPQAAAPSAPNNWGAALSALSNPGRVQTMGATAPLVQGYQPSGGVNQAFLQQAQGRPGMNSGFLSALAALQNRPGQ